MGDVEKEQGGGGKGGVEWVGGGGGWDRGDLWNYCWMVSSSTANIFYITDGSVVVHLFLNHSFIHQCEFVLPSFSSILTGVESLPQTQLF